MKYIPVTPSILQASYCASQVPVRSKTSGKTRRDDIGCVEFVCSMLQQTNTHLPQGAEGQNGLTFTKVLSVNTL